MECQLKSSVAGQLRLVVRELSDGEWRERPSWCLKSDSQTKLSHTDICLSFGFTIVINAVVVRLQCKMTFCHCRGNTVLTINIKDLQPAVLLNMLFCCNVNIPLRRDLIWPSVRCLGCFIFRPCISAASEQGQQVPLEWASLTLLV